MSSKQYFEDVAQQWDTLRKSFFTEGVREKAFAAAGLADGSVAADLGAGTGFITEGLVQRGVRVIAVDQSDEMLKAMQQKFAGHAEIEYRNGDAGRLPVEDRAVDYAFANMYLHHVDSPPDAIKEMARILKPGGKLVITDLDEHTFEFLRTEMHDRWLGFRREDVKHWFEQAGFGDVAVDSAEETCTASSSCGSERASVSIFVASGKRV